MTKTKAFATAGVAVLAILYCCSLEGVNAQENAQRQIPPSLVECYNTSYFMNRDNRLPANMETLISLIEKIENSYLYNSDMRQLAVSLLHRFRQDGIERAPNVVATPDVIPYSPTGYQFPKFRILLQRLIPGNAMSFPNDTLTREERCSLHFMLSSSIETRIRGDENQVCNQLSQFRAERIKRSLSGSRGDSNFMGDVEILDELTKSGPFRRGAPQSGRQQSNWNNIDYGTQNNNEISQCPVENGVVWTPWGTVAAGTVIAGIAAGLQPQSVQLKTLLALASPRQGAQSLPQMATVTVDNRWASTLAGDLAEVALVQVPVSSTESAKVGASGVWNSTVMPKWYFLTQRTKLEMTDAEIRGGLDGLIIAMNIGTWRTQASSMKLSQLLRMYYSKNGVLGTNYMACTRKENFPNVAPLNQMIAQTSAFAQVLDREMRLRVTLSPSAIATFSTEACNELNSYVPGSLNDPSCGLNNPNNPNNPDVTSTITPMTNIYVFLDTSWQYQTVADYLNYILQGLNINPYASQVTLLAAADGSTIVNTTNSLPDIFQGWNVTTHSQYVPGFNLPTVLRTVSNLTQAYMNAQQANNSVGGLSMVALLMPNMVQISDADSNYATTQLQYIYEQIPDLHFIYYAGGTISRFQSFVRNPTTDLFALSIGQKPYVASQPVLARIIQIPRRIINPLCGSAWYSSTWGTYTMTQYAGPGTTNFYRLVSNYFFPPGSNRGVTVNAQFSSFTVCTSRTTVLPTPNNSSISSGAGSDVVCQKVQGNSYTYDLSGACNGYTTITQCPNLYISVSAPAQSTSGSGGSSIQTVSCSNAACQTPQQASYTISVANLDCRSGSLSLIASLTTLLLAFFLIQVFK